MQRTRTNFGYAGLFVVFFLQLQYTVLSMIELVTWQQSSEFYISLLLPFVTNSPFLQHVFAMPFTSLFHLLTTCIFLKADMPLYTY